MSPTDSLHGWGRQETVAKTMMQGTAALHILRKRESFTMLSTRVGNCISSQTTCSIHSSQQKKVRSQVCLPKQKSYKMKANKTQKKKIQIFSLLENSVTDMHLSPGKHQVHHHTSSSRLKHAQFLKPCPKEKQSLFAFVNGCLGPMSSSHVSTYFGCP